MLTFQIHFDSINQFGWLNLLWFQLQNFDFLKLCLYISLAIFEINEGLETGLSTFQSKLSELMFKQCSYCPLDTNSLVFKIMFGSATTLLYLYLNIYKLNVVHRFVTTKKSKMVTEKNYHSSSSFISSKLFNRQFENDEYMKLIWNETVAIPVVCCHNPGV